ncbi:hypothetical protein DFS33DRAFT_1272365 [Desarmillaria ectypa]|nr:hypothetical protein DFS33DRAFT_1272365 [Desarmillaria ectypa]
MAILQSHSPLFGSLFTLAKKWAHDRESDEESQTPARSITLSNLLSPVPCRKQQCLKPYSELPNPFLEPILCHLWRSRVETVNIGAAASSYAGLKSNGWLITLELGNVREGIHLLITLMMEELVEALGVRITIKMSGSSDSL